MGRISSAIAPRQGELLIEIGPGRGVLTRALLESGAELIAVEIDRDLVADLQREFEGETRLTLHCADALQTDFTALAGGRGYRLVGNLPYNISTPLIFHLLAQRKMPGDMHFMLQKEVVRRMAAPAGGRDYGRLSVMCQNRCETIPLFDVGPEAFKPAPKVDSSFVRLLPRPEPLSGSSLEPALEQVVRQAFSRRRKTLRNSLSGLLDADRIEATGIDPALRAERLSLQQFITLAAGLETPPGD